MNDNPLEKFRGSFDGLGFKLGLPSYLWPAGYAENVRRLSGIVDEVQLLAYEPHSISPVPREELDALATLAATGPAYSLHLPVPGGLADEQGNGEADIAGTIEAFRPLAINCYVLHIEGDGGAGGLRRAAQRLERIIGRTGIDEKKICVENLIGIPFAEVWDAVKGLGVSVCFDVGHHLYEGGDPLAFMARYGAHIRMAHLHGVAVSDHQPLSAIPEKLFGNILAGLSALGMAGPAVIENFNLAHMAQSLECLAAHAEPPRSANA
jgi:sugar phosphate isomerase/epimerase